MVSIRPHPTLSNETPQDLGFAATQLHEGFNETAAALVRSRGRCCQIVDFVSLVGIVGVVDVVGVVDAVSVVVRQVGRYGRWGRCGRCGRCGRHRQASWRLEVG